MGLLSLEIGVALAFDICDFLTSTLKMDLLKNRDIWCNKSYYTYIYATTLSYIAISSTLELLLQGISLIIKSGCAYYAILSVFSVQVRRPCCFFRKISLFYCINDPINTQPMFFHPNHNCMILTPHRYQIYSFAYNNPLVRKVTIKNCRVIKNPPNAGYILVSIIVCDTMSQSDAKKYKFIHGLIVMLPCYPCFSSYLMQACINKSISSARS